MLGDSDDYVTLLDWWDVLGLEKDITVLETRAPGIMDRDGYTEMPVFSDVLLFPCVTGTLERMRHGGRSGWRGSAEG
jgi:hypothetical protein